MATCYQIMALLSNVFVAALLIVVFIVTDKIIEPFQRGFFCDDESLQKPYVSSPTLPSSWAIASSFFLVIIVVIVCDCVNQWISPVCGDGRINNAKSSGIKPWIRIMIMRVAMGLLGLCFTAILVNIFKLMVGRLRPHFLAVCNPPSNCTGFVSIDVCNSTSSNVLRKAMVSFPSGQAAGSAFSTVFLALYVEYAMQPSNFLLLKPLIQFLVLFGGIALSLTRISDYIHHWSDVLAGFIIGALFAFYIIYKQMELPNRLKYLRDDVERSTEDKSILPKGDETLQLE